jgi:hypothetical protein
MTRSAQWRAQRRLLVAQATLQRARLAHEVHELRSALPAASLGTALALGVGAAAAVRRWRAAGTQRSLLQAARAWLRERR